tara:strand:- start:29 stop:328 length:300 start_codon:yes stop_codon:yes gene_type:complete
MKKLYEIKTRKVIETYYEIEADSLEDAKETAFTRSNRVNSITFEPYVIHTREFSWQDYNVGTEETPIIQTLKKYKKEFNHVTNELTVINTPINTEVSNG